MAKKGDDNEEMQAGAGPEEGATAKAAAAGKDAVRPDDAAKAAPGDVTGEDGAASEASGAASQAGQADAEPGADGGLSDDGYRDRYDAMEESAGEGKPGDPEPERGDDAGKDVAAAGPADDAAADAGPVELQPGSGDADAGEGDADRSANLSPEDDDGPIEFGDLPLGAAIEAYQAALMAGALIAVDFGDANTVDEDMTDAIFDDMATYVRKIDRRATPDVLGQQLKILKHRHTAEISMPERIALNAFLTVLLDLDEFAAAEQARIERETAPAPEPVPVPIEDTTLEPVDGFFETW